MFGLTKKPADKNIEEAFDNRARIFMAQTSLQISEQAMGKLRGYFGNLINTINDNYRANKPVKYYNCLDTRQLNIQGVTVEQLRDFSKYDFTVVTLKNICKYYNYTIWVKEKAGGIYVCISTDATYVREFASTVRDSYS